MSPSPTLPCPSLPGDPPSCFTSSQPAWPCRQPDRLGQLLPYGPESCSLSLLLEVLTCHVRSGGQGGFRHAGQVSGRRGEGAGGAGPVWGLGEAADSRTAARRCLAALGHLTYIGCERSVGTTRCPCRNPLGHPPTPNHGSQGRGEEHFLRNAFQDGAEGRTLGLYPAPAATPSMKWTQSAQGKCYDGIFSTTGPVLIFLYAQKVPRLPGRQCIIQKLACNLQSIWFLLKRKCPPCPPTSSSLPSLQAQSCLPLDDSQPVSMAVRRSGNKAIQRKLCKDALQTVHKVY